MAFNMISFASQFWCFDVVSFMKNSKGCPLLIVIFFWSFFASAADKKVTFLMSMNKPPYYVYNKKNGLYTGIDHDIVQAVSADINLPIRFVPLPANRLLVEAKSGKWAERWIFTSTIHYAKALPDYLPKNYKMSESVYGFNCLRVLKSENPFATATSLNGARIVKTLGYTKETVTQITGIEDFYMIDVVNDEIAITMLGIGRADVAFMESFTFYWEIKKLGISPGTFDVKPCSFWPSDDSTRYLLGADIDDEFLQKFNSSLRKLKENGAIDTIIKRYLPDMPNGYN